MSHYRRDIDGLRAVAILSAILFHTLPQFFPGGYTGVEIFFVISGYLITGIILRDCDHKRFSLSGFYIRRCRRILPALSITLAGCLLLGWFGLLPEEYKLLGSSVVASGLFYQNIQLWQDTGYFDLNNQLKPLVHLWTLSIEEQFYLLWPLALLLIQRLRLNLLFWMTAAMLASFALNAALVTDYTVATFYLMPTRFWELLVGGLLAAFELRYPQYGLVLYARKGTGMLLSTVGCLCILTGLLTFNSELSYPGWWSLAPVIGTALIILAGPTTSINRVVLGNRVAVFIGLISYPLYLWHWPLLAFARNVDGTMLTRLTVAGTVIVAFVLAIATYALVEKPIRSRRRDAQSRRIAAALLVIMTVIIAMGAATQRDGFVNRLPEGFRAILGYRYIPYGPYREGLCHINLEKVKKYSSTCIDKKFGAPGKTSILLWGDSHAAHLYPGFKIMQDVRRELRMAQFSSCGCPPVFTRGSDVCIANNRQILDTIRKIKPDTVILTAHWFVHMDFTTLDQLDDTISQLKKLGIKHIVVVGPVPEWNPNMPMVISRYATLHQLQTVPERIPIAPDNAVKLLDAAFKKHIESLGLPYVSAFSMLCNDEGCLTTTGNSHDLVTWDYSHLTNASSDLVIRSIPPEILGLK